MAALLCCALLPVGVAAAQTPEPEPRNLIVHGGFEAAAASLRLPEVSPFPLVAGGWGSRGAGPRDLIVVTDAPSGRRAVQLTSRPASATHLVQDVALATDSFTLDFRARRVRGRQTLRVLGAWDRMDPETADGLHLVLGAGGVRVRTDAGAWGIDWPATSGAWVAIRLTADARTGLVQLWIDETLRATVPGRLSQPRTLVVGGHASSASRFRYDDVSLFRLAELELAELRENVRLTVDAANRPWILDRLDDAAAALRRGSEELAQPEIRAALRLLDRSIQGRSPAPAEEDVRRAMSSLSELLGSS